MNALKSFLVSIGLMIISIQLNAQVTGQVTFDLSDLTLDTIGDYIQPSFIGCHFTDIVGAPHMPVIIKQYLLPKNAEITSISISDSSHYSLPGAYMVYPTQNPVILDGRPAPPFVEPDSTYYTSNGRFKDELIEVVSLTNYMGYNMVRLRINPLQYIASDSGLILFNSIVFAINFQITGTDPLIKKITAHQYDGIVDYISKTVENPTDIDNYGVIADEIVPAYNGSRPLNLFFLPGAEGDVVEYLIITNDALKNSFQDLADWKMSKGIPALVVTTSQIEEFYPGFDLAEKIFNYLKDVYHNWLNIYVLLGGDTDIIPARITTGDWIAGFQVSDLYYSNVDKILDDDYCWNQNHNGYFWDDDDFLDLEADLIVGRTPVHSTQETSEFINKIKSYEQNSFPDQYKNITMLGAYLSDCPDDATNGMRDWWNKVNFLPNNFSTKKLYDDWTQWGGTNVLNRANAIDALSGAGIFDSQHIIAHEDHSGFNSIGTSQKCQNEKISITDLDNIAYTPGSIYKIMFAGACESNQFNKESFSEHFMNGSGIDDNHKGIGIAYIGNSGIGLGDSFMQGFNFFKYLYDAPLINLGKIFIEARNGDIRITRMKNLNFLGDPELPVWTAEPDELSIIVNPGSLTNGENSLEITITGLSDEEEALVCIYKENEVYGVKTTTLANGTHKATFDCKPDTEGELVITATCTNHLYAKRNIEVSQKPDVHLYITGFDPSDLYLHRGENSFNIVLKNGGSNVTATDINSRLSSLSQYVIISPLMPPSSGFDSIIPGETQPSTDMFTITVSDNAPDLVFIRLLLLIQCDQGEFSEEFVLQVQASQLVYRGNKISSTSDGDIIIDPGDLVSFRVELLNSGCLDAKDISATISPDCEAIIGVPESTVYFRQINSHDTAWCNGVFKVQMASQLQNTNFPIIMMVNYDGIIQSFPINIGNEKIPTNLNFTSTNTEILLNWIYEGGQGQATGYNIYRLDPESLPPGKDIEDSTLYQRLNFYVNQFSTYKDIDVEPKKEYYYKISCYSNSGLPQGPYTPAFKAWTTLPELEPWPVYVPNYGVRSEGSPIIYDAIPTKLATGDNPELEIFFPMDDGSGEYASKSALFAFYSTGDELYNIDGDITQHAGFANFENAGMKATPIIGEMNNDNSFGEVAFATTFGNEGGGEIKKLFIYSAGDMDDPPTNGNPDLYWQLLLGQPVKSALVGANLLDGMNEDYKIVAAEMWTGRLDVRNVSNGNSYPGWPKDVPRTVFPEPEVSECITFGVPVVVDIDLDYNKEIIVGCDGNMGNYGLYFFNYDGTNYDGTQDPPVPYYVPVNYSGLIGMGCRPVVANIDQSDSNPEIIFLAAYSDYKAQIIALDFEGQEVANWGEDNSNHNIDISHVVDGDKDYSGYPSLTVADLDNNGIPEVIIADAGKVYVWNANGAPFNEFFPIEVPGLECPFIAPLVANIDKDPENEIIIADPVNDFIYAFNLDGTQVPGWPLVVDGLIATPAIGDVNHDGLNEIVAVYGGYVNVWKTEGETGHDQWPLYRLNSFNNAVYEEPACTYDPNNPIVYDHEENTINWNDYNVLTQDLIIPQDETLTIRGRIAMPDNSKIVVERGGTLIVEGGVITSACSGLWQGIQVWGYKDESQFDPDFRPGKVELNSNAVIENARIGVATAKLVNGVPDENYAGGQLLCKKATFLNNIYGVRFYNYRNFDPKNDPPLIELDYASYISNSTFITNGLLAENGTSPAAFIRMDDVVGIRLSGNQFINTSGDAYEWGNRGYGIESYNAAYFMNGLCLDGNPPCSRLKENYFFNLFYGIRSLGQGRENATISILNSVFNQNQNGIFISFVNNVSILFNKFSVAKRQNSIQAERYGVYIEASTGYIVEENIFEDKYSGFYGNIGMYISNSGSEPNEIYKNDFKNLQYGIVAYGQNRSENGEGLCLKCNNFEACSNDIHVIPAHTGIGWLKGSNNQGIATLQGSGGSDTAPAGNTFTDVEEFPQAFNYFNHENCNMIDYHYHQNYPPDLIIEPNPRSEAMVHLSPEIANYQDEDHACPSNFGGGNLNLNLERSIIISEDEKVTLYSDSIQELKDGGDTYGLNQDVYNSTTEEAYEIRQKLLDESPYLSDTVMKSAIFKENVLPNAMIRDVLVANPQSAKSSEILEKVNKRIDPMPEEMMSEILEGRTYKGNLEILEDKLAAHKTEKYKSLRKLELYYKQDTLNYLEAQDSLVNLWESESDPSIQYRLAFYYFYNDDSLNCFSTLNFIPQLNDLSPRELIEFDNYSELMNLLWPLRNCTMNIDSITADQLSSLAESSSETSSFARNTLLAAGLIEYQEPIYLADELKSTSLITEKPKSIVEKNPRLKVFPNPAKDYIIVSYNLSDLEGVCTLQMYSAEGKPLYQRKIQGIENQVIISTEILSSSPYVLKLLNGSNALESINFIISK